MSYTSPSFPLLSPLPPSPSLSLVAPLFLSHIAIWGMTHVSLIFSHGAMVAVQAMLRSVRCVVSRPGGDVLSVTADGVC